MKKFLVPIVAFFIFVQIKAQTDKKTDSLLNIIANTQVDTIKARVYLELSNLTMYNDQAKTMDYISKAEALYAKSDNKNGFAKLYAQKANFFYRLGQIDSARYYLVNSVNKSLEIEDTLRAAVIRHNIGILDEYQGDVESAEQIMDLNIPVFKKYQDSVHLANAYLMKGKLALYNGFTNIALKESYKALKIHEKIKDDFRKAEDLFQIGLIYQTTSEHKKAIDLFKESISNYAKYGSDQSIAQVQNYTAFSLIKLNQFSEAEQFLKKALEISKQLKYTANIARVYQNWGNMELVKGNYNEALKYSKKSYSIWSEIGNPNNEASTLLDIGKAYSGKNEYKMALEYFDKSIANANTIKENEILNRVFLEKSDALEHLGDYKQSLVSFKKSKILSDSIFNIEQSKATKELKTIYETEKKEQEIALQKKEIDLLEEKAKVNNLQKILLGGGLFLSLCLFGFGYYGIRQKMKRNKLEKEKVDAELAFKKKELTTHALHLAKKNEVLEDLKQKAEMHQASDNYKNGYLELIRTINFDLKNDNNWENFSKYFQEVHKDFNRNVKKKFPDVTSNELRLMSLLKMNLSSKEIANILNISPDGIKKARYRLRKKLKINTDDSLQDLVLSL